MRGLVLVIAGATAVFAGAAGSASRSGPGPSVERPALACAAAIRTRVGNADGLAPARMPPACYNFGVGALGEPISKIFSILGSPDGLSYSPGYRQSTDGTMAKGTLEVSYLYPRNLNRAIRERPAEKIGYSMLTLLTRDGVVRAGDVMSFAGLRAGDPVSKAYLLLGKPSRSNRPGDLLFYDPLPFYIGVDEATKKITGFRIWMTPDDQFSIVGPSNLVLRNSRGKVVGVSLLYVGPHP